MENNNTKNTTTEEIIDLFVPDDNEEVSQQEEVMQKMQKEVKTKNSGKQKKSVRIFNTVRFFVLLIAAGVLVYASYSLTDSYLNYKEDEKKYASINEMFLQNDNTQDNQTVTDKKDINYSKSPTKWVWDYKEMLQYNNEARGYIKLDGTRIQYPIVAHNDNEFYLTRGSDKITNGAGSIFIDYRTVGLEGNMCVLYGHNMLDGTMFKDLMNYRDNDFCKKHPTFDVYVGYKHYRYYVFSVFSAKDIDENVYKYVFESDSDFQSWINRVYSKSRYRFECDKPTITDKIIMCSTCIDDNGNRQLVCMYRGEEIVN